MSSEHPQVTLDDRRGWARVRAVVVCLVGIAVIAPSAAMLALVVLAAVARFWTWIRRRDKDPAAKMRTRRELVDRALAAYAQAGEDVPAEHRQRFEQWFAATPCA